MSDPGPGPPHVLGGHNHFFGHTKNLLPGWQEVPVLPFARESGFEHYSLASLSGLT
jgi:hypothetical protein